MALFSRQSIALITAVTCADVVRNKQNKFLKSFNTLPNKCAFLFLANLVYLSCHRSTVTVHNKCQCWNEHGDSDALLCCSEFATECAAGQPSDLGCYNKENGKALNVCLDPISIYLPMNVWQIQGEIAD